jgi:hypothetical protein
MAGTPAWRRAVNRVDGFVSPRADAVVRAPRFADVVAIVKRLEVRTRRRLERQTTQLLHAYNLPSAADTRRIVSRLAAVEARARDISIQLDEHHEPR